jgi:ADP-ribosylglycohydrolase
MKYPHPGILVHIGIADAYGAGAEYLKLPRDNKIREECLKFDHYVQHPWHKLKPGAYTDDTEMSAANATVLAENDPPFTQIMFANSYVREFSRGGMRQGYAGGFYDFLASVKSGQEFLEKIKPHSDKNGACMRAPVIGVLPTVKEVLDAATIQASITHNTSAGIASARCAALMAHFTLYEGLPFADLPAYCLGTPPAEDVDLLADIFTMPWSGKPVQAEGRISVAVATMHAVLDLMVHQKSLMDILRQAILWGGDVDSVAAIAWGIASPRYKHEKLPEFMLHELEGGSTATGATYLIKLGETLMDRYTQ